MGRPAMKEPNALAARLAVGCWTGTQAAFMAVYRASRGPHTWHAARAAIEHVTAPDRVWMRPEEYTQALNDQRHFNRSRDHGEMWGALGISQDTSDRMRSGQRPMRKHEAIVVAHVRLRLPVPDLYDREVFQAYVADRFGASADLDAWLELPGNCIADVVRGFKMGGGVRQARPVTEGLIRALDWVDRMGPVPAPYGDRTAAAPFPRTTETLP